MRTPTPPCILIDQEVSDRTVLIFSFIRSIQAFSLYILFRCHPLHPDYGRQIAYEPDQQAK